MTLISVLLIGKDGVEVSLLVRTKHGIFVGKDYYNQGLYLLNVLATMNENASSFAFIVDSFGLCRSRHVNFSYGRIIITCPLPNLAVRRPKAEQVCRPS